MDTDDADDTASSRASKQLCDAEISGSSSEKPAEDRVDQARQALGDDAIQAMDPEVWGKLQRVLRGKPQGDPHQGF